MFGYIRVCQSLCQGPFVLVQVASLTCSCATREALIAACRSRYDVHTIRLCSEIHEVHALDEGEHTKGRKYEVEHCESLYRMHQHPFKPLHESLSLRIRGPGVAHHSFDSFPGLEDTMPL